MKLTMVARSLRVHSTLTKIIGLSQVRFFQPDFTTRDPNSKPKIHKYPPFYDPYGPKPSPSDKIIELAERIVTLPPNERCQIGPTLSERQTS
ncbi:hypothetical protein IC575_023646 [Cucumis melo]